MTCKIEHFVRGRRTVGLSVDTLPVTNPATGAVTGQLCVATPPDVEAAVAAAYAAAPGWAATPPLARARILFRFKALVEANMDALAACITAEHGKVLADARGEVTRGLEVVEFACGIPHLLKGEYAPDVGTGVDSWNERAPLGVCVGISPFNFPAMVPMWMFPVALACGNTFVLKPSEKDPSVSLMLAELLQQAGCPEGVFNVLQGDKTAVEGLLQHPDVAAVSFVGSTPVARHINEMGARFGKRVQALGGAKNHMLILPDADLQLAVDGLVGAAYGSAGERCMAISVAVCVGEATADAVVSRLREAASSMRVGPGDEPDMDMGPLITAQHRDNVSGFIGQGVAEGADLVLDGRAFQGPEGGFFLGPTLFDRVTVDMRIYQEEIFGPVLSVVRVDSSAEALALVNAHPMGNGTAIFTRDGGEARRFARAVTAGMVGINVPIPVPMAFMSFGGWKDSAFSAHHMHGPEGVRFFTRMKTTTARWPEVPDGGNGFVMPTLG